MHSNEKGAKQKRKEIYGTEKKRKEDEKKRVKHCGGTERDVKGEDGKKYQQRVKYRQQDPSFSLYSSIKTS